MRTQSKVNAFLAEASIVRFEKCMAGINYALDSTQWCYRASQTSQHFGHIRERKKAISSFTVLSEAVVVGAKVVTLQSLSANSPCQDGENACVNGDFAQCVGGKFTASPCAGGTKCFALPLVLSRGTSITCDTEADAAARIAQTGATGGVLGRRSILEA